MAGLIFSKFYGGFNIDQSNYTLPFKETAMGPELSAEIAIGTYTVLDFCTAIASALNTAGTNTYTVTFDRVTRLITISSSAQINILAATGMTAGLSICPDIGITVDTGLVASYTGLTPTGYEYRPQFPLQDYMPSSNNAKAVDATVNKSANGIVQVVRFGVERFIKFSIQYANNEPSDSVIIKYNTNAISELNDFMQDSCDKNYIEFMHDENEPLSYEVILLESTSGDSKGVGYELKEMTSKKLSGYWETGILNYKKIEE